MGNKDLEYNLFLVSGGMFSLRYPDPSRAPVAPASGGRPDSSGKDSWNRGRYLGIWKLVSALSFSFLAAGIWSLGKVVLKKKGRKEVIPFLPFLTAGYLGGIVW